MKSVDYYHLILEWQKNIGLYAWERFRVGLSLHQQVMAKCCQPRNSRVGVRSGHGVGKTTFEAILSLWHLECFLDSKTIITSGTKEQIQQILWSEYHKLFAKNSEICKMYNIDKRYWMETLFKISSLKVVDKSNESRFIVGRVAKGNDTTSLQGFHSSDIDLDIAGKVVKHSKSHGSIMVLVEEASSVKDEVLEVFEGALSTDNTRLLIIGNPNHNIGFFSRAFKSERDSYTALLKFKSTDSPFSSEEYRDILVRKYGEKSNVVRVRADGEFPLEDDDTVIPYGYLDDSLQRRLTEFPIDERDGIFVGLDPARYGDDRSVLICRQGHYIKGIKTYAKIASDQLAQQAVLFCRRQKAQVLFVGTAGMGGSVLDMILSLVKDDPDMSNLRVVDVKEGGRIPNKQTWNYSLDIPSYDFRSFMWQQGREFFEHETVTWGIDKYLVDDAIQELLDVHYKLKDNKFRVETKDDIKKRIKKSPDIADAFLFTLCPALQTPWSIVVA